MSESGKELYDKVKEKIETSQKAGTLQNKFGTFWKMACTIKTRQHDMRYLYEDTSREFVDKNRDKYRYRKGKLIITVILTNDEKMELLKYIKSHEEYDKVVEHIKMMQKNANARYFMSNKMRYSDWYLNKVEYYSINVEGNKIMTVYKLYD